MLLCSSGKKIKQATTLAKFFFDVETIMLDMEENLRSTYLVIVGRHSHCTMTNRALCDKSTKIGTQVLQAIANIFRY